ncbi:hypothetical protein GCM10007392_04850 [Saccharospirillum salsuginis]|uniref:Uncharacterized protein n=1 Tax=Saccharospirillum salsuginis TaxID=418750 RepID=A0A918N615_9GAMM|nr:hypothetical protein GCM10007392_04850 [Saccharospirillum salsuginis]
MGEGAGRPVQVQQTAARTLGGRVTGNQLFGEFKIEIADVHAGSRVPIKGATFYRKPHATSIPPLPVGRKSEATSAERAKPA